MSRLLSAESLFRLVLAFVLSTALWLYVNSRNASEVSIPYTQGIAVSVLRVPQGLTVSNTLPAVYVNIAPTPNGLSLTSSDFLATVNVHGMRVGIHRHVPVQLTSNPNIKVLSWRPRFVTVVLDELTSIDVPVQIMAANPLPGGYALQKGTLRSAPTSVTVTGPKQVIDEVSAARIQVSLSTARSSINLSTVPDLVNVQGEVLPRGGLTIFPQHVRVHATIIQLASFKTLPITASVSGQPAAGFGITSIQVRPAGLTAYGPPSVLGKLRHLRTRTIRVTGLKSGRKTFHTRIVLPHRVSAGAGKVEVILTLGPVVGESVTRTTVVPENLAEGLAVAHLAPGSVLVTLSGPSSRLASSHARVRAHVNLGGLGDGVHSVQILISHPHGLTVDSVQPHLVRVTIKSAHG